MKPHISNTTSALEVSHGNTDCQLQINLEKPLFKNVKSIFLHIINRQFVYIKKVSLWELSNSTI